MPYIGSGNYGVGSGEAPGPDRIGGSPSSFHYHPLPPSHPNYSPPSGGGISGGSSSSHHTSHASVKVPKVKVIKLKHYAHIGPSTPLPMGEEYQPF